MADILNLLPNESLLETIGSVAIHQGEQSLQSQEEYNVYVTNYRICFVCSQKKRPLISIPLTLFDPHLEMIEIKPYQGLILKCLDFRTLQVVFKTDKGLSMFLFALRRTNYKNAEKRFCFVGDEARAIGQEPRQPQLHDSGNRHSATLSNSSANVPSSLSKLFTAVEANYHLYQASSELTESVAQGWQVLRSPEALSGTYLLPPSLIAPLMTTESSTLPFYPVLKWSCLDQRPNTPQQQALPLGSVFGAFYGSVSEATAAILGAAQLNERLANGPTTISIVERGGEKAKENQSSSPVTMKSSGSSGQIESTTVYNISSAGNAVQQEAQMHFARQLEAMYIACNSHRERDQKMLMYALRGDSAASGSTCLTSSTTGNESIATTNTSSSTAVNLINQSDKSGVPNAIIALANSNSSIDCAFGSLGLPSTQEVMASYAQLSAVLGSGEELKRMNIAKQLSSTKWNELCLKFVSAAQLLANELRQNQNVVIYNGEVASNSSYFNLITTLVQLLIDPYYRTYRGFCELIDKEWSCFGFPFHHPRDEELSLYPQFVLLLFSVSTLWQLHSHLFEFRVNFLTFMFDSVFSSRFSTFLRVMMNLNDETDCGTSIFRYCSYYENKHPEWKNESYNKNASAADLLTTIVPEFVAWPEIFCRFNAHLQLHTSEFMHGFESRADPHKFTIGQMNMFQFPQQFLDAKAAHKELSELSLKDLGIVYIPNELKSFTGLTRLTLDQHKIANIHVLGSLTSLEYLSLKSNQIQTIPESIRALKRLQALFLDNNKISSLPGYLCELTPLTLLSVGDNFLSRLPSKLYRLTCLEQLILKKNAFTSISTLWMKFLTKLSTLDLSNNKLASLPGDIAFLQNLAKLNIQSNLLTSLPESIGQCAKLESLIMDFNRLTDLPASIGNLANLQSLMASQNKISSLVDISTCSSLKVLHLAHNELKALPKSLSLLPRLEELNLNNNGLTSFPEFAHMKTIAKISVTSNFIKEIPFFLAYHKSLKKVDIINNPLVGLPRDLEANLNLESIVDWLRSEMRMKVRQLRTKVIVVGGAGNQGEARVGKSMLIKHLSKKIRIKEPKQGAKGSNGSIGSTNARPRDETGWTHIGFSRSDGTASNQRAKVSGTQSTSTPMREASGVIKEPIASGASLLFAHAVTAAVTIKDSASSAGSATTTSSSSSSVTFADEDRFYRLLSPDAPPLHSRGTVTRDTYQETEKLKLSICEISDIQAIHNELFFQEGNLYLIVFDVLDSRSEYFVKTWIQRILSLVSRPHLLFCGTYQESSEETPEKIVAEGTAFATKVVSSFNGAFVNQGWFFYSITTFNGVNNLRDKIKELVLLESHKVAPIPLSYMLFESFVHEAAKERKLRPYIAMADVKELCAMCGITAYKDIVNCLNYYNKNGVILYLNNNFEFIVLSPPWISSMLKSLMSSKFGFSGMYLREDVETSWRDDAASLKHLPLMLSHFGLLRKLDANSARSLLPAMHWLMSNYKMSLNMIPLKPAYGGIGPLTSSFATSSPGDKDSPTSYQKKSRAKSQGTGFKKIKKELSIPEKKDRLPAEKPLSLLDFVAGSSDPEPVATPPTTRRLSSHHSSSALLIQSPNSVRSERGENLTNSASKEQHHHRTGSDNTGAASPLSSRFAATPTTSSGSLPLAHTHAHAHPNVLGMATANLQISQRAGLTSSNGGGLSEMYEQELADCFAQQKEAYISPPLLHEEVQLASAFWPESKEDETLYKKQFSRIYTFACISSELPILFFIQLTRTWRTDLMWQNGFIGTNTAKEAKVHVTVSFNSHDAFVIAIYLRFLTPSVGRLLFSNLVATFEKLTSRYPHLSYTKYCLSPSSSDGRMDRSKLIKLAEIEAEILKDNYSIMIDEYSHNIEDIAPDLVIASFRGNRASQGDFVLGEEIGQGGFSHIFKASYKDKPCALKRLMPSLTLIHDFEHEVMVMTTLQHENLARLYAITISPSYCILMEFFEGGSLYELLKDESKPMDWTMRLALCLDIARGVQFMHSRKPFPIAHLDMKSLNVMLTCKYPFHSVTTGANGDLDAAPDSAQSNTNTTSPNSPMLSSRGKSYGVIAKIIDFGASCVCDEAGKVPESEGRKVDNPIWLAPEIIGGLPYSAKVDTYSYGMILWEILTRTEPFGDQEFVHELEPLILEGERPPLPPSTPPGYATLITTCWNANPDSRPTWKQIIQLLKELQKQGQELDKLYNPPEPKKKEEKRESRTSSDGKKLKKSNSRSRVTERPVSGSKGIASKKTSG